MLAPNSAPLSGIGVVGVCVVGVCTVGFCTVGLVTTGVVGLVTVGIVGVTVAGGTTLVFLGATGAGIVVPGILPVAHFMGDIIFHTTHLLVFTLVVGAVGITGCVIQTPGIHQN